MVPVDTSKYPGALFPADRLRAFQFDNYEGKQLPDPLEICIYNLELSAWFHQRLSVLEIVLRNSLFDQLSKKFFDGTTAWAPSLLGQLDESRLNDFHRAKTRLSHASKIPTDSQVVTELNFGFWRQMLSARYEATLWTPCLRHAFVNLKPKSRPKVYEAVDNLYRLRNRIAHSEPIIKRDLAADSSNINTVLEWLSPDAARWSAIYLQPMPIFKPLGLPG